MSPATEYLGKRVTYRQLFEQHPRVEIPIIQRDYAQGRQSAHEVRTLFLGALHEALLKSSSDASLPLDLDFVYGNIENDSLPVFCPLDGQQRLTTLFLLHWYLAWSDGRTEDFVSFIRDEHGRSRFAYAVRPSSGEFFDGLAKWFPQPKPVDTISLAQIVEDQPWFFEWWKRDPTIQSALAILDAINELFRETTGLYDRLIDSTQPCITFQLLDLQTFGLSDDLYIKMNARGKPLTEFETFKALLEKHVDRVFPVSRDYQLLGKPVTFREYFSQQIDTTWTDLFWAYRSKKTNLFDDHIMSLLLALAIITRNPDADNAEQVLEALRNSWSTLSFQTYLDLGCLDELHIRLFATLLDALSGDTGKMRRHLPTNSYFNEETAFRQMLDADSVPTHASLVQVSAYVEFFCVHGLEPDPDRFIEWMRVVRNLTVNSNIERPAQFLRSHRSVLDLLPHSGRILEFLVEKGSRVEGFSIQQIREERIKAALILKSVRWKDAVILAERHPYFNGQIEFLLDFSGVLHEWTRNTSCDWSADKDNECFARFSTYCKKASLVFGAKGLLPFGDWRTERALLSIGDYTFVQGQNNSFLEDADGPVSWKRLLRGEHVQNAGPRRGYLQQLLDRIDVEVGVQRSLDDVIRTTTVSDKWRHVLVQKPAFIAFCGKRQIRRQSSSEVYLLRGVRRSGEHAELFTYDLYLGMIPQKQAGGELAPFGNARYQTVRTDAYVPSIVLSCEVNGSTVIMQIWNSIGKYHIALYGQGSELAPALKGELTRDAGCALNTEGNPISVVAMADIEAAIDGIVKCVRKHGAG